MPRIKESVHPVSGCTQKLCVAQVIEYKGLFKKADMDLQRLAEASVQFLLNVVVHIEGDRHLGGIAVCVLGMPPPDVAKRTVEPSENSR